jgi:hypothetical protein
MPAPVPGFDGAPACAAPPPAEPVQPAGPPVKPYNNSFSCFHDYDVDYCHAITQPSVVSVDFIWLWPTYTSNDVAFKTNAAIPGVGGPGEVDFNRTALFTPRVNLVLFPWDELGISGSWFFLHPSDQTIQFTNANPQVSITTPSLPLGGPSVTPAGFPNHMTIQNSFRLQVADLDVDGGICCGDAMGYVGVGVKYASISHGYNAATTLDGGTDLRGVAFGNNYTGVGPEICMNLTWPANSALQFFGKASGALLMGNRNEKLFVDETTSFERTNTSFIFMPAAEAEAGISLQVLTWQVHPVLKVSAIAQYWSQGGNSTDPQAGLFLWGVAATAGIEF